MSYNSGVIVLVILNQPRAMHRVNLKLLARFLAELYDTKSYTHVSIYKTVAPTLRTFFAAVPQINISSVQASYNEGSSVNLSCTASGTPDPDVKWIRNGEVKSSGKKAAFLPFSSIKRPDDGQYICRANNSAGNYENHVTLVVYCK